MIFRNDLENHFEAYSQDHPNRKEYFMRGCSARFRYVWCQRYVVGVYVCCTTLTYILQYLLSTTLDFLGHKNSHMYETIRIISAAYSLTTYRSPANRASRSSDTRGHPPAPRMPSHSTGAGEARRLPSSACPPKHGRAPIRTTTTSSTVAAAAVRGPNHTQESLAGGG